MNRRRAGGCLAYVVACLVIISAIVSWADFLFKPLTQTELLQTGGMAAVVADLLRPVPTIYGWPLAGYIFIISTVLLAFVAALLFLRPIRWTLNYLEASEAPVSVLESKIDLHFEDSTLATCRVSRMQRLHANQACIEAYHYNQTAHKGTIDPGRITIDSRINNDRVTKDIIHRASGKSVEIIERFSRPLPTSWLVTYFPDRLVTMLHDSLGLFQKVIVTRQMEAFHSSEYDGDSPVFQMKSVRYPVSSITISLDFPVISAPADDEVVSYLISSHAAQSVSIVPSTAVNGRKRFTATVRSLGVQQTFRVQWRNSRLEQLRATRPELFRP